MAPEEIQDQAAPAIIVNENEEIVGFEEEKTKTTEE